MQCGHNLLIALWMGTACVCAWVGADATHMHMRIHMHMPVLVLVLVPVPVPAGIATKLKSAGYSTHQVGKQDDGMVHGAWCIGCGQR